MVMDFFFPLWAGEGCWLKVKKKTQKITVFFFQSAAQTVEIPCTEDKKGVTAKHTTAPEGGATAAATFRFHIPSPPLPPVEMTCSTHTQG